MVGAGMCFPLLRSIQLPVLVAACALSILALAGCGQVVSPASPDPAATTSDENPATATPEAARDFTLESLGGDSVTLSELRGQWVLVNFWATWCPPCVSEMPYLQRVSDEREMSVLGVNFKESAEAVSKFIENNDITFPVLMNPDDLLVLFYQARSLPRTFVIDPDGNIALRIIGAVDEAQFEQWLDEHDVPRR
jgi:thiol-disulfide isomerase/thioredoxin